MDNKIIGSDTVDYKQILNTLTDGILLQNKSKLIVYANTTVIKIFGFTPDYNLQNINKTNLVKNCILYTASGQLFPLKNLPMILTYADKKTHNTLLGIKIKRTKELKWYITKAHPTLDQESNIKSVITIFQDVTSLKRATQKLLFQKAQLEAQNEASQEGILVVSPEGKSLSFNKKYSEIWGVKQNQLVNITEKERIRLLSKKIKNKKKFVSFIHRMNKNQNIIGHEELELKDDRWIERYTAPVLGPLNTYYGRIWYVKDITEQKKDQKRQDVFLGITSHELKTPLASIKAYLHLINSDVKNNKIHNIKPYTDKIDSQVDKLDSLIKDLLDLSMIKAGRLLLSYAKFDFDQMILDVINDIYPTVKHKIIVKGLTNKYIYADKLHLNQVFSNIIRNAVKYSPNAKKIVIGLSSDHQTVKVKVQDY